MYIFHNIQRAVKLSNKKGNNHTRKCVRRTKLYVTGRCTWWEDSTSAGSLLEYFK